jgi:hypothetical protein
MDTVLINNYYPYFIFVQAKGREWQGRLFIAAMKRSGFADESFSASKHK